MQSIKSVLILGLFLFAIGIRFAIINFSLTTKAADMDMIAIDTIAIRDAAITSSQDAMERFTDYSYKSIGIAALENKTDEIKKYIEDSIQKRVGSRLNKNSISSVSYNLKIRNTDTSKIVGGSGDRFYDQFDISNPNFDPTTQLNKATANYNYPKISGEITVAFKSPFKGNKVMGIKDEAYTQKISFSVEMHHRNLKINK